ncbi:hypothetical protein ACIBQ1_34270 [Nonomuraea sp. NPDC050153]|uniref:hypothetical protein n=1 Tax=Nonomuraea sp. NPDC050153 TaxID=3364359 RepID=UPI00378C7FD9
MQSHYDDGWILYVVGIASAVAGARTTINPVFASVCHMCASIIGTMLSNPEDIRDKARDVRAVTHDVEQAKEKVTSLLADLQYWKEMGQPQMEDESVRFTNEVAKTENVYRELAGTLDQLAKMSAQGALASASLGGLLLALAFACRSAPVDPFANSMTTAAATQVQRKARNVLVKMLVVYGSAAALALLASVMLSELMDPGLTKAATLTGQDAPAFEQVVIQGLPVPGQS